MSSTASIKLAFTLFIGKIGCSEAIKVFLPLPVAKAKLIQNFLDIK
jgi:hypothetical protein